jgi:hypothetical protein
VSVNRRTLKRRLPDGTVKMFSGVMTRREIGQAVAYCLVDNGAAGRREATRAGMAVEAAPAGEWIEAPGGYAFRWSPA